MIGKDIHDFAKELWPLNRSLTGVGVRETLDKIKHHLPNLVVHSVASGTQVFDWKVPNEWHVREAFIITPEGERICDFSKNNLHLLGYSIPFRGKLPLDELKDYLYTLPDQPDAIPYMTSYYEERWGFCLSHEEFVRLEDGEYEVVIDSDIFEGVLNYGELIIPGKSEEEIFLSTYICHPSMANNELSGPTVMTFLAKWLNELGDRRYSYRLIYIPETIGSITYLSLNHHELKERVVGGFNVSCVGDNRSYSFLPSRNGNTTSDRIAKHVLGKIQPNYTKYKWTDRGSDERQYCSPGIDLPIASVMRTKYGKYPEYHTSLDDLINVVTPEGLDGGYWAIRKAIELFEKNYTYKTNVLCEPQMGKRGLYPTISKKSLGEEVKSMMDFISYCDGENDLLDIADLLGKPTWDLYEIAETLEIHNLISKI